MQAATSSLCANVSLTFVNRGDGVGWLFSAWFRNLQPIALRPSP